MNWIISFIIKILLLKKNAKKERSVSVNIERQWEAFSVTIFKCVRPDFLSPSQEKLLHADPAINKITIIRQSNVKW